MSTEDIWEALYNDDAIRRAEELVAATISLPHSPRAFFEQLLALSENLDSDIFIGLVGSLAGLVERAALLVATLRLATETEDEDVLEKERSQEEVAGQELHEIGVFADLLREFRDSRGELA